MPLAYDPRDAADVAAFGAGNSPAATINYDVPLPGAYSVSRMQPIAFDPAWFAPAATNAGRSLRNLGVVTGPDNAPTFDPERLRRLYERLIPRTVTPAQSLLRTLSLSEPAGDPPASIRAQGPDRAHLRDGLFRALVLRQAGRSADDPSPLTLEIPTAGLGQSVRVVHRLVDPAQAAQPTIALVETFQLSSFLGDYGLGRTLETFTLLPGERTTIAVETWRSTEESREDSSSVFDSSDVSSQTRFTSEVEEQSGATSTDAGTWASSLSTNVGGGFSFFGLFGANASAQTYDAATSQYERSEFSKLVSQATSEHASQVNNSRNQSVQMASASVAKAGASETTTRELSNINLRRVLNFVFRELNQTYETITSLRDVRLAFYNGNEGSARLVPLSQLRAFVDELVLPAHRDDVARTLLSAICECVDETGAPVGMLEVGTRAGGTFAWQPATLGADGRLAFQQSPLAPDIAWRVTPGPLNQGGAQHVVPGVVTGRTSIVLRTDSVAIEALLGKADALDPYATAVQATDIGSREADILRRTAEAERLGRALVIIEAQADPAARVDAWERIFGDKPDIQVVPAAAAIHNGAPA